ncbi:hypothetical protein AB0764_04285 [Priestia megaterium]|uniref:hypothetical protein n=1 Tax=Priestia megaterium TaxID=1404 RepID=UPI0038779397
MVKSVLVSIALIIFAFQNPLINLSGNFSFYDELTVIFICTLTLISFLIKKGDLIRKETFLVLILSLIYFFLGFVSNLLNKNQLLVYALLDAFTSLKFLFVLMSSRYLFRNFNVKEILKVLSSLAKVSACSLFVIDIFSLLTGFFPIYEYRYNLPAQQLFFAHPTFLVSSCVLLIGFLQANLDNKKDYKYIHMLNFVIFSTLRTKGFLFIFFFYLILIIVVILRKRLKTSHLVSFSIIGVFFGLKLTYKTLFESDYSPRTLLTKYSFVVAKEYFPLGSGFGTYGSYVSAIKYSKIYRVFNFQNYYGLSPKNYSIITDTFWPMIIAQTGYAGLIVFVLILIILLRWIWQLQHRSLSIFLSAMALMFYLLITSSSESSFANYYATGFCLFIGLLLSSARETSND